MSNYKDVFDKDDPTFAFARIREEIRHMPSVEDDEDENLQRTDNSPNV